MTRVHTIKIKASKLKNKNNNKNQNCLYKAICDPNKISYYNYNKKCHYLNYCLKALKN